MEDIFTVSRLILVCCCVTISVCIKQDNLLTSNHYQERWPREDDASAEFSTSDCPPWFLPSLPQSNSLQPSLDPETGLSRQAHEYEVSCYCSDSLRDVIQCSDKNQTSYMIVTLCMSYEQKRGEILVGSCPYFIVTVKMNSFWITLPQNVSLINEKLCRSINREGLLCAHCIKGYGISVYSNDLACVNCQENPYGWAWFLFTEILLQTLFFLAVFFFRISVNTAKFNGFLLFCQIIISTKIDLILPDYLANIGYPKLRRLVIFYGVFYRFWVLDFFTSVVPRTCFYENLGILGAVAMGYVSALYPFIMILVAYMLVRLRDCNFKPVTVVWKPYQKLKRIVHKYIDLQVSLLHTFSSLLVLSYSKLALVSFSLLYPAEIFDARGERVYKNRWYHNAEIELFERQHIPYGILALVVFMTFVIVPPLILVLYPFKWFRWILHKMKLDRPSFNAFIDSLQGGYKDGTNNTKDRRHFAALYFVLRLLFFATRLTTSYRWELNIIVPIFMIATILVAFFQPYKNGIYNLIDTCFLSLLAFQFYMYSVFFTNSAFTRNFPDSAFFTFLFIALLPIIYFLAILLYHFLKSVKATKRWRTWYLKCQKLRKEKLLAAEEEWPYRLMIEENTNPLQQKSKTF